MKSAYSTLACGMPVFLTLVLGMPLLQPGHRREMALGAQLCPRFRGMFPFAKS